MDAIDAYKTYIAVKNHFTLDSYDYFKYNKRTNVTYDSFLKRKDKVFFAKLGSRKEEYLEDFLVANFLHDPKIWVGELLSEESEERYKNWKKKQESLTYVFKNEIEFIDGWDASQFNELFHIEHGEHPKIIRMLLRKEISLETFTLLNSILNFLIRFDKAITDPVYKEVSKLCKKYQPFLKVEKSKVKTIVKNLLIDKKN